MTESRNDYISYPRALQLSAERWGATPEEVAAWIWLDPKHGGLAAYCHASGSDSWRRFVFDYTDGDDYVARLGCCWFSADELDRFTPRIRYVTATALLERWAYLGIAVRDYIRDKIKESRLLDIHPSMGGTQWIQNSSFPPEESALFALAEIEAIEMQDGGRSIHDKNVLPRPVLRVQEEAIVAKLSELGFNPKKLPKSRSGTPGVKSAVREALMDSPLFSGKTTFGKAWERLKRAQDVADA